MYDSTKRFFTMAETYDAMSPHLVPQYDFLQNEALGVVSRTAGAQISIIDLGAGSGRFLEKALERHPKAKCWWVDYSGDFLAVAGERLARFGDRVKFVTMRLEENWEDAIPGPADAIFSMSAIHHLESAEKKALYARCHDKLKPGGWFVNTDEMKTVNEDAYRRNMDFWWQHFLRESDRLPTVNPAMLDQWRTHFENWKLRNIDNYGRPKSKGDDLHDRFTDQLDWLREIGYANVDVYVKYHLWCVIGGQKPKP
jgi:SAM-dependent methyltransferase